MRRFAVLLTVLGLLSFAIEYTAVDAQAVPGTSAENPIEIDSFPYFEERSDFDVFGFRAPVSTCSVQDRYNYWQNYRKIWYRYTAQSNTTVTVYGFNNIVTIHTGPPDRLIQRECAHDTGRTDRAINEQFDFDTEAGQTYYIVAAVPLEHIRISDSLRVIAIDENDTDFSDDEENPLQITSLPFETEQNLFHAAGGVIWYAYTPQTTSQVNFRITSTANFYRIDVNDEFLYKDSEDTTTTELNLSLTLRAGQTHIIRLAANDLPAGAHAIVDFQIVDLAAPDNAIADRIPPNDAIENATVVATLPFEDTIDIQFALDNTSEAEQYIEREIYRSRNICDRDAAYNRTVWYSFTMPQTTVIRLYTDEITGYHALYITEDDIWEMGGNACYINRGSTSFVFQGGTTYYVAVTMPETTDKVVTFHAKATSTGLPGTGPDGALVVPQIPYTHTFSIAGVERDELVRQVKTYDFVLATEEDEDCFVRNRYPYYWYRYQSPSTGRLTVRTEGPPGSYAALVQQTDDGYVMANCIIHDGFTTDVEQGQIYYVLVFPYNPSSPGAVVEPITVYLEDGAIRTPENTTLATAMNISALPFTQSIDFATIETVPPSEATLMRTIHPVWYTYTAPEDQFIRLRRNGRPVRDDATRVWRGSVSDEFDETLSARLSTTDLSVAANETIYIRVDRREGFGILDFTIETLPQQPVANYAVESAAPLSLPLETTVAVDTIPNGRATPFTRGIWYEYQSTGNNVLQIETDMREYEVYWSAASEDHFDVFNPYPKPYLHFAEPNETYYFRFFINPDNVRVDTGFTPTIDDKLEEALSRTITVSIVDVTDQMHPNNSLETALPLTTLPTVIEENPTLVRPLPGYDFLGDRSAASPYRPGIWYSYTPETNQFIEFKSTSNLDEIQPPVWIWRYDGQTAQEVASYTGLHRTPKLLVADAGVTYYIQIDGLIGDQPNDMINLSIEDVSSAILRNVNRETAQQIPVVPLSFSIDTRYIYNGSENTGTARDNLWYAYQPQQDQILIVESPQNAAEFALWTQRGNVEVPAGRSIAASVVSGESYFIEVIHNSSRVTLQVNARQIPANPTAQPGANRGEVYYGAAQAWQYNAQAGEVLTLEVNADQPANEADQRIRLEQNLLDTLLIVRDPSGDIIAEADDIEEAARTDSIIERLSLPVTGVYTIEVRSYDDLYAGTYTLNITTE